MFHYLKDDKITNSTNSLEPFFGHLKENLNVLRGIKFDKPKKLLKMVYVL